MMRRSKANARRRATSAQFSTRFNARILTLAPVLGVDAAFLVVFLLVHSSATPAPGGAGAEPTKPQGTKTDNSPTTEKWTVAKGLPSQVTRLAFSAADSSRGYAVAFVSKQSQ